MYSSIEFITTQGTVSVKTLADLADKVNKPGNIDAQKTVDFIHGAIAGADDLINTYLRAVYSGPLPLVNPPTVIRRASAEMTLYTLWQSLNKKDEDNPFADRNKFWLRWLSDIAVGKAVLELNEPGGGRTDSGASAYNPRSYSDRVFSPERLRGRY
jgi:phage gp36-like protein